MSGPIDMWESIISLIEEEISPVGFSTWIKTISVLRFDDESLFLTVPSEINKSMIESRYKDLIKNAVFETTGRYYNIVILLEDEAKNFKQEVNEDDEYKESHLISRYTFDNYIVGKSNRFAHAACLAVAEGPSSSYNPLFLWGGVGLGKTHLMHAIGNYIIETKQKRNVLLITAEMFTVELINAIKDKRSDDFKNKYRSIDVLLVDDIQFIAGKVATEEEFFHTFNTLHQAGKQIILTSDRPPKEIVNLAERLRSRFEWGLIGDVQPPEYETRIAILQKKAQDKGIDIGMDVLMFIADQITLNIRELEGVFNTLVAYQGLINKEINIEMAKTALQNYNVGKEKVIISPEMIIEATSKYFRIRPDDIRSQRRTKELVIPRHVAMYLCKNLTNISYQKMGKHFGDRDHTTILHAIGKVEKEMLLQGDLKNAVETLTKDLSER